MKMTIPLSPIVMRKMMTTKAIMIKLKATMGLLDLYLNVEAAVLKWKYGGLVP
jgi:hypothetical protein